MIYEVVACVNCNEDVDVPDDWDDFVCPYCTQLNVLTTVQEESATKHHNKDEPLIPFKSVLMSWCSRHNDGKGKRTEHLWMGYRLICLVCWPSKRKEITE